MAITIKTTFSDKDHAEDVEFVMMTLEGITIRSLSNHDADANDYADSKIYSYVD